MPADNELVFTPARRLARMIAARKVSATEVMRAFIAQIERVNGKVNAIVTLVPDAALAAAKKVDRARGERGLLAGLPIAYKDLLPTKGVRTTHGSPIYADHVPSENHALVDRLSAAGAILIGKTNTPEFGAGSQTFNKVFGATRNPYDLRMTSGGSSGGAAAAVASGMLPFADGSVDTVVSTFVLCTVDAPDLALREIGRILRPDGQLLFIEHVRSDSPTLAAWQDRLARPWRRFARGCRCNRATDMLIVASGLELHEVRATTWHGMPPIVRPLIAGRAHPEKRLVDG